MNVSFRHNLLQNSWSFYFERQFLWAFKSQKCKFNWIKSHMKTFHWKVVGDENWFRWKAFLRKRIVRRLDTHHRGGRRGRRRTFPGIDKRLTRFSNPCDILMCLILYVKIKREFQTAIHSFMWLARVYFWKNGNPSAPWASRLVTDIEILEMTRSGLDR
jgi:hypothetical protein